MRTRTPLFILAAGLLLSFLLPAPAGLARADDERALKKLKRRVEEAIRFEKESLALELFSELEAVPGEGAARLIVEAMAAIPSQELFDEGVRILTAFGAEKIDGYVAEILEARKVRPVVLATVLTVAGAMKDETSESWLLQGLEHKSELVQRSAIEALKERRSKNAIPRLIDLLERKKRAKGTVAYSANLALMSLTGHCFDSIEDWRKFWEANKETLDPSKLEAPEGPTGVAQQDLDKRKPEFFGVEIISRRVVFVIDISGSMTMWDEGGEDQAGKGPPWKARQRIVRTKRQLSEAIRKLSKGALFNVIAFNNKIAKLQKELVPAVPRWKGKALKFVKRLAADSATHTDEALAEAFRDPRVDTIILLSDGAPMKSRSETAEALIPRILEQVRDLNRIRRVRIFTFGFEGEGEWPPGSKYARHPPEDPQRLIDFLTRLAKENGGTYTSIR
ncbi:MAG: HEAT repeat domain-containing protein [Planctomycetota bacterium]